MWCGVCRQAMSPEEVEEILLEGCPEDYLCPISMVMMTAPVVAEDGITYQQAALQQLMDYAEKREWPWLNLIPRGLKLLIGWVRQAVIVKTDRELSCALADLIDRWQGAEVAHEWPPDGTPLYPQCDGAEACAELP